MKKDGKSMYEEVKGGVNEVIDKIREIIKEGGARRLIIKNKKGEVVFQTQLAIGVGGATLAVAMAPVISAIGMFAMFLNDYQILVEREADEEDEYAVDAQIIEINEDEDEEKTAGSKSNLKKTDNEKDEKTVGKKKK